MNREIIKRIEALERHAGIAPETDCPEGYRELGEKDMLAKGDVSRDSRGNLEPTARDGEVIGYIRGIQGMEKIRYFRKLAEPEPAATAEPEPQDCPDGCLPFDLAKALAGHPVRTRGGDLAQYDGETGALHYRHSFAISGARGLTFTDEGKYVGFRESEFDLFLVAPKPSPREIVEGLRLKLIQRQSELSRDADAWHAMRFRIDGLRGAIEALAEAGY